jgi:3',5'-nucleoside bisphosphate phosphatase
MTSKLADLHSHTIYSDGTDTPERVIELAAEAGLSAIAITDHDNVMAFPRAQEAAAARGVELLTGIEMSASYEGAEVHVLGLLLDVENPALQRHIETQMARRVERTREMVRRLQQAGVEITAEEVFEVAGEGTVARPHVARVLQKHGYVANSAEAFQRYIGPKNPGFVPGSPLAPAKVIRVIREAGGVPVVAHPIFLQNDAFIEQFVKDGLVGIEVYHSSHTPKEVTRYEQLAEAQGLLKTGGSDYHGTTKEGLPIGKTTVPYTLVEALRQWQVEHSTHA